MRSRRKVVRLEKQWRKTCAEAYLPQIPRQPASGQAAEQIKQCCSGTGLRMGGSLTERLPAILEICVHEPGVPQAAKSCRVMEAQHQKSRAGIGPRRWQARRLGKRQEVSHVSICEIHLLRNVVPP